MHTCLKCMHTDTHSHTLTHAQTYTHMVHKDVTKLMVVVIGVSSVYS